MTKEEIISFYKNKNVFVTGHTGFKGAWLCRILTLAGANVTGYAQEPPTNPSLFAVSNIQSQIKSVIGDIRNFEFLQENFNDARPEIVFHLAAQPIVRAAYEVPRETYEINVMGTVNILECSRLAKFPVRSVLNVTTDKVYMNKERQTGYREDEILDGFDPYSNSKSCSELVTHSYRNSFFQDSQTSVSTARAGNVIGGGDFARDRIIPDCIRAVTSGEKIIVRNAKSIRPYQHVLEPLFVYLMIAKKQYEDSNFSDWYNVGPDREDCVTTGELVNIFCEKWGEKATWIQKTQENAPHEASFLMLDSTKLKKTFNWHPTWHIDEAVAQTVQWTKAWQQRENILSVMDGQIKSFIEG